MPTPISRTPSRAPWGGFANAGQTCSGIERTYVVREVADRFIAGVVRETERLTVGDPLEWDTEIGPMVSAEQAEIVTELVDDAIANGAERLTGGPRVVPGFTGKFIAPTVLTGVTHEMRIMREEIFGPVLPIVTVDSEEQALEMANDSQFGLGASIWTKDRAKGERMAGASSRGWCGSTTTPTPTARASARGRREGVRRRPHALEVRVLRVRRHQAGRLGARPDPGLLVAALRPHARNAVRASAQLVYGRNGNRLRALREGAVPLQRATAFRRGASPAQRSTTSSGDHSLRVFLPERERTWNRYSARSSP